jgi:Tol biopolymer transport system component
VTAPARRRARLAAASLLALPLLAAAARSQSVPPVREPVLKQVRVPHAYYWREMYVPQVTSGPASASWSPDGAELVYAMQGGLWRQRVGGDEARQLTAGPGYDHQPDWAPDGRRVVYASYRDDAVELRLLDLESGDDRPLVANGAVNVDPRWSPDGRRIAYVSTAHEGRWHVFTVSAEGGASMQLTEDRNSGLPRYYYSVWDHYLSPSWSPDGRELILVGNRGRIWGTGGLWRMAAERGAPMRELHYEETTWKARPDWSPDGRRVVYSSYDGRQWNQLWLLPAEGGDRLPLTHGEYDLTAPRWSRDGRRIAAVSNEGGNTSLVVLDVVGGRRQRVEARTRRYRAPMGRLRLSLVDAATGARLPARVSVTGADGRSYAPDDAWRHADEAFVRGEQPFEYGYFHADGAAELAAPAGPVAVEAWRGPEFEVARFQGTLAPDGVLPVRLRLRRLDDPGARGQWGGDLHVHMNYGGHYRNTPARLALQGRAEGLHVLENLVVNKEQRIPDIAGFRPGLDPASTERFLLAHGQEFHTSFWGHTAFLGLREHYLMPDFAGYANTAMASLVPTNAQMAEVARAQGALVGYVHPFDVRPDPDNAAEPLTYALPVDAALGKLDYLEVMGFSDHLVTSAVWYRLLNCGFRIPAGAGTDAFPNFASLRGPAGLLRTYVQAGPRLTHASYLEGLRRGRTFVTNAPLLTFAVEGRGPGDEVTLAAPRPLRARVAVRSAVPLDRVEVIGNGEVVGTVPLSAAGTRAEGALSLPGDGSAWYVLRAYATRPRLPVLDLYPFASTSPVYVMVGQRPVRSREDAAYFVRWVDRVVQAASAHTGWNTPAERAAVMDELARARAVYVERSR